MNSTVRKGLIWAWLGIAAVLGALTVSAISAWDNITSVLTLAAAVALPLSIAALTASTLSGSRAITLVLASGIVTMGSMALILAVGGEGHARIGYGATLVLVAIGLVSLVSLQQGIVAMGQKT